MKQPWVDSFMSAAVGGNAGRMFIRLKPRQTRKSAMQLVQELRPILAQVPGVVAYPQVLPPIRIGGYLTKSQYQFTLQDPDTHELYEHAPKFEAKLRTDPKFRALLQDVTSDLQITNPQINVEIDRDKASTLGITAGQVEDALNTAYSQRQVSTIYAPNNAYRVITETQDPSWILRCCLSCTCIRRPANSFHSTPSPSSPTALVRSASIISASCRRSPSPSTCVRASRSEMRRTP
jgi:HAE1 family hydrophobic/amphiphilic exporter-1